MSQEQRGRVPIQDQAERNAPRIELFALLLVGLQLGVRRVRHRPVNMLQRGGAGLNRNR